MYNVATSVMQLKDKYDANCLHCNLGIIGAHIIAKWFWFIKTLGHNFIYLDVQCTFNCSAIDC